MSIRVENLSKTYKKQHAVDHINFSIKSGEIVGFLGPNGAGKTTTMKILTAYIPPSTGIAMVNGLNVETESIKVRKICGYLPEHNPLYTDMYVLEYLHFSAGIHKITNKTRRVKEMIEVTGLGLEKHKKIGQLSKGYRQRVGLANAMIHNPSVLILDEPTSGLDPNQIVEIRRLITELGKEKTVLLSTHIMQEVEAMCSRVMIINKGKIVADGETRELKDSFRNEQVIQVSFNKVLTSVQVNYLEEIGSVQQVNEHTYLIKSQTEMEKLKTETFNFAVRQELILTEVKTVESSLEDIFKNVTR